MFNCRYFYVSCIMSVIFVSSFKTDIAFFVCAQLTRKVMLFRCHLFCILLSKTLLFLILLWYQYKDTDFVLFSSVIYSSCLIWLSVVDKRFCAVHNQKALVDLLWYFPSEFYIAINVTVGFSVGIFLLNTTCGQQKRMVICE
jgi:hypothetical protein